MDAVPLIQNPPEPGEMNGVRSRSLVMLPCHVCGGTFVRSKKAVQAKLWRSPDKPLYCSQRCFHRDVSDASGTEEVQCEQCGTIFRKTAAAIAGTNHNFCGHSCAAIWGNAHKNHGCRRSKAEDMVVSFISENYDMRILLNDIETIGMELDIVLPELSMAFEVNGPHHAKPIFGIEKLRRIQELDRKKSLLAAEAGIHLVVLDISHLPYYTDKMMAPVLALAREHLVRRMEQPISRRPAEVIA